MEVRQTLHQEEAARETADKELPERGGPVEVQQTLHQEEAARETGNEELPERGSPAEVQRTLHQEETGREADAKNFPEQGTLWSLKIGTGGEMRRPIIVVALEEACRRRGGNGKEAQESWGTATSAWQGLLDHGKSGRILSERWKTKETRMILTTQPEIKQGIQFQDTRDGSQGSGT